MNELVQTPNGKGTVQWHNADGSVKVWILRRDYTPDGIHLPTCKVSDMSPTIPINYQPEELKPL